MGTSKVWLDNPPEIAAKLVLNEADTLNFFQKGE
jgi:hypothetical protein